MRQRDRKENVAACMYLMQPDRHACTHTHGPPKHLNLCIFLMKYETPNAQPVTQSSI